MQKAKSAIERLGVPPEPQEFTHLSSVCTNIDEDVNNIIRRSRSTSNLMDISNHYMVSQSNENIVQQKLPHISRRATISLDKLHCNAINQKPRENSGTHSPDWSDDEEETSKWSFSQAKWLG